ncbi:hypothetical protein QQF64_019580 [Cirrhinus molitorella]|uniref:Ig-like domain-containing protein n=1 Tax=Cirrhinus molitorella TaxID=172907 RepID=A0ABR3LJ80_9TELE
MMRVLVIFLLGIHLTSAATHTLQYFYTSTSGIENFPEFMTAGIVDGQQIDYYDSNIRKAVQKAEWISGAVDPDYWNRNTQIYVGSEAWFKNGIEILKPRFNQTGGVHTVQQMLGSIYALNEKTVSPQVSLLQKDPSSSVTSVTCHATGFYPSGITITWMKNDQEHHEDVEVGELLPNEDGTFQRTSTIRITPDEQKSNKYSCVVEHQGETKEADEIRTNVGDSVPIGIIVGAVAAVVLLVVIGVCAFMVYQKKKKLGPGTSTDSATSLLSSSNSSSDENIKCSKTCESSNADRTKSLTSLYSDPDHGYNSGPDNNSCNGSHSGSDSTSDITSVCSNNKEMQDDCEITT